MDADSFFFWKKSDQKRIFENCFVAAPNGVNRDDHDLQEKTSSPLRIDCARTRGNEDETRCYAAVHSHCESDLHLAYFERLYVPHSGRCSELHYVRGLHRQREWLYSTLKGNDILSKSRPSWSCRFLQTSASATEACTDDIYNQRADSS